MTLTATLCCTARPGVGGGHVNRSLTLANALALRGWRIAFAVPPVALATVPSLYGSGYEILSIADTDASSVRALRAQIGTRQDLFVADFFAADAEAERAARALARKVLAVDDAGAQGHDCDLVVSAVAATRGSNSTELLHGRQYALLDQAYARARAKVWPRVWRTAPGYRVLVFFGLTDHHGVSIRVAKALKELSPGVALDVVIGRAAPTFAELHALSGANPGYINLHSDIASAEMAGLAAAADASIGAGGVAAIERCVVGLPAVVTATADNQLQTCALLAAAGAAYYVGPDTAVSGSDLVGSLNELIALVDRRAAIGTAAAAFCDGNGTARVVGAIERLCGVP